MSREVFEGCGLYVTRVAAPAAEGEDRARWEVFTPDGPARLSRVEVRLLILGLLAELLEGLGG